jgi:hypothetical protein
VTQVIATTRAPPAATKNRARVLAMLAGTGQIAHNRNVTRAIVATRALPAATKERARVHAMLAGAEAIARNSYVTQAIVTTRALPVATKERARVLATLTGWEAIARSRHIVRLRRTRLMPRLLPMVGREQHPTIIPVLLGAPPCSFRGKQRGKPK